MQIWAPYSNINETCAMDNEVVKTQLVASTLLLARVDHEEFEGHHFYRNHPTYLEWHEYLVFALDYAMQVFETVNVADDDLSDITSELHREFELATSGDFKLEKPPFWGREAYHWHQRCMIASIVPGAMIPEIAAGEITWVNKYVVP